MQKHNTTIQVFLILIISLLPNFMFAQKWVADTVSVEFQNQNGATPLLININEANDLRDFSPATISLYEKKKWLFFPVNQVAALPDNLSTCTKKYFSNAPGNLNYSINFHRFYISTFTTGSKRNFTLFATVELFNNNKLEGSIYYEIPFEQKKKDDIELGFNETLGRWTNTFQTDLKNINLKVDELVPDELYNFRRGQTPIQQNFYVSSDVFAGLDFWGIDAEIWFSEPEGAKNFKHSARIVRFYNHSNLQSIAFGKSVTHWNWRINENWIFSNKASFLLGINNWKDVKTQPHKLEEILRFDLSATQKLSYNRLDKTGLVFGVGLLEDFYYIIYHQPKIKIAGVINATYKF